MSSTAGIPAQLCTMSRTVPRSRSPPNQTGSMTSASAASSAFPAPFRISSAADILGYIPHALGFHPRESLVFLTMSGKVLGATLRLDLPHSPALRVRRDYAETVCRFLSADTAADGVLIAMYTHQPWENPAAPPFKELMDTLQLRLNQAGMPVRDAWLVSESSWREYLCDDPQCCPWPGRDLDQIRTSALGTEMVFRGSSIASSSAEAVSLSGSPAWQTQSTLDSAYSENNARSVGFWTQSTRFGAVLQEWESYMGAGAAEQESLEPESLRDRPDRAGYLLASLHCRAVRDALLVLAALGREAAMDGAAALDLLQPRAGGTTASTARPDGAEAAAARFGLVLLGECETPPDWRRLDAAFELFRELVAAASGEARAALNTMMAWLEWLRGRGSRAQHYLDVALTEMPDYRLAQLLQDVLSSGHLSTWSRSSATAWRGRTQDAA